jgi:ABC-type polysaccharide transport system permease subunit
MTGIVSRRQGFWSRLWAQKQLMWMSVPIVLYVILFTYVPLAGWTMAFQDFKPVKGFPHSPWVGLKHFINLFTDDVFKNVLRNTLAMSFINLVFNFTAAIGLVLLLNEVKNRNMKWISQTISYLPHFLSWVIVAGLVSSMLSSDGIFSKILVGIGILKEPRVWLGQPKAFWWIIGVTNVWKEVGWNTIIYLATMAAIDPALYEAAEMDGCGRFSRIRHITLPGHGHHQGRPVLVATHLHAAELQGRVDQRQHTPRVVHLRGPGIHLHGPQPLSHHDGSLRPVPQGVRPAKAPDAHHRDLDVRERGSLPQLLPHQEPAPEQHVHGLCRSRPDLGLQFHRDQDLHQDDPGEHLRIRAH